LHNYLILTIHLYKIIVIILKLIIPLPLTLLTIFYTLNLTSRIKFYALSWYKYNSNSNLTSFKNYQTINFSSPFNEFKFQISTLFSQWSYTSAHQINTFFIKYLEVCTHIMYVGPNMHIENAVYGSYLNVTTLVSYASIISKCINHLWLLFLNLISLSFE